jgi:hypothetical protein
MRKELEHKHEKEASPQHVSRPVDRRSFLKGSLLAGSAAVGAGLLTSATLARAQAQTQTSGPLNKGDIAILRFLAAAELIEADLWTQYAVPSWAKDSGKAFVASSQP